VVLDRQCAVETGTEFPNLHNGPRCLIHKMPCYRKDDRAMRPKLLSYKLFHPNFVHAYERI